MVLFCSATYTQMKEHNFFSTPKEKFNFEILAAKTASVKYAFKRSLL